MAKLVPLAPRLVVVGGNCSLEKASDFVDQVGVRRFEKRYENRVPALWQHPLQCLIAVAACKLGEECAAVGRKLIQLPRVNSQRSQEI